VVSLHETASGIAFAVKVQPRARRNAIVGELGDAVKVALTAPPVDGRANQACVDFFADLLKLQRSAITILSGESSRNKVIRVAGISAKALREKLQL
jgi:uncharacterized protein (TIGR00251 family)